MIWLNWSDDFSKLSALFIANKQDQYADQRQGISQMMKEIRKIHFQAGLFCVHCRSMSV